MAVQLFFPAFSVNTASIRGITEHKYSMQIYALFLTFFGAAFAGLPEYYNFREKLSGKTSTARCRRAAVYKAKVNEAWVTSFQPYRWRAANFIFACLVSIPNLEFDLPASRLYQQEQSTAEDLRLIYNVIDFLACTNVDSVDEFPDDYPVGFGVRILHLAFRAQHIELMRWAKDEFPDMMGKLKSLRKEHYNSIRSAESLTEWPLPPLAYLSEVIEADHSRLKKMAKKLWDRVRVLRHHSLDRKARESTSKKVQALKRSMLSGLPYWMLLADATGSAFVFQRLVAFVINGRYEKAPISFLTPTLPLPVLAKRLGKKIDERVDSQVAGALRMLADNAVKGMPAFLAKPTIVNALFAFSAPIFPLPFQMVYILGQRDQEMLVQAARNASDAGVLKSLLPYCISYNLWGAVESLVSTQTSPQLVFRPGFERADFIDEHSLPLHNMASIELKRKISYRTIIRLMLRPVFADLEMRELKLERLIIRAIPQLNNERSEKRFFKALRAQLPEVFADNARREEDVIDHSLTWPGNVSPSEAYTQLTGFLGAFVCQSSNGVTGPPTARRPLFDYTPLDWSLLAYTIGWHARLEKPLPCSFDLGLLSLILSPQEGGVDAKFEEDLNVYLGTVSKALRMQKSRSICSKRNAGFKAFRQTFSRFFYADHNGPDGEPVEKEWQPKFVRILHSFLAPVEVE